MPSLTNDLVVRPRSAEIRFVVCSFCDDDGVRACDDFRILKKQRLQAISPLLLPHTSKAAAYYQQLVLLSL